MMRIEHLKKQYGDNLVLNDISLSLDDEVTCILGPSGAGKSTFLRCLNLLESPTGGDIKYNGQSILQPGYDIRKMREEVTMVFQHFNLFPLRNVVGNVMLALLMFCKQAGFIEWLGTGNTAVGLTGSKLMLAIVLNGIFGALMTLGCGLYAPCMVMVFMLGLNPFVAFPIMMGAAAALMPVAGRAFIKAGSYEWKISLCFTLSGIVAVLIATNFVLNMDVHLLAWGIIVVVLYTSISYVRKGLKKQVPEAEASGLASKKAL
ncbi:ATP-binding cassette domain-containing protein [Megasphaera sp.]|uniref:ATP-binding cassette domain-containing protein n=1 Tax=Megasphaera sp. TaxID=2023260 RepID=UPI003F7E0D0D